VIVRYAKGAHPEGSATPLGDGSLVLQPVPAGMTAAEYSRVLEKTPGVESAEPDHLLEPAGAVSYTSDPNDTAFVDPTGIIFGSGTSQTTVLYAKSWALRGVYSARFSSVWPALGSAEAAPARVHVAVLDTGFYLDHPDARFSNITPAIDECGAYYPASARLVTDGDVTPVPVYSIVDDDPVAVASHGTMTASEIGAAADNLEGSLGAAYDTQVDIYKVQGVVAETGNGLPAGIAVIPESAIINAINDAVTASERDGYRLVINISLVLTDPGTDELRALKSAVAGARSRGAVVVAASGNEGSSSVHYPAACPGAIAVGASTVLTGVVARDWYSNYGSALDIMAPGTNIWGPYKPGAYPDQTFTNAGYAWWTGTSMATPYVASAAALLLRVEPSLTATEVISYLTLGATDLGSAGWDSKTGWGELDAYRSYLLLATPRTTVNVVPRYALEAHIDFSVADRDSDTNVTTFYRLDDSATLSGTSATFSSIGQHKLEYWSVDSNGVREATQTVWFTIAMRDVIPPITSSDATSTYRGSATVRLSASDPEPDSWGLAATHYALDGAASRTGTIAATGASGLHTLLYWSTDQAGNIERAHVATFTVTPLASSVSIAANTSTIRRGAKIKLSGSLTPALPGDYVRIRVKPPGSHTWRYLGSDWHVYRRTVTLVSATGRGVYSPVSVALNTRGRYYFRAVFAGDTLKLSRKPCTSRTISVYVR